jgi:hypothetical protein
MQPELLGAHAASLQQVTPRLLRSFAFTSGAFAQLNKTYQN